ncbi:cytochrome c biogenesis protein ResB [Cohnella faecalis]|uniref:cytochrome c biogenesis protein ResB n=1 Tax=Cohnella faecalis TaxID=2315694 RepID=UPI003610A5E1
MFQNTKCECGHQNHAGTVLCESCGKPLMEDVESEAPLEMRYDGVARRSQKENPGLVDRVWNFFSSVKIAVYLIVITLIGAMLGTVYPQASTFLGIRDDPAEIAQYYKDTYGTSGVIYHALGLSRTYESWWFIGLLVMIGTSLIICSLDRVLPLYKALSKQQVRKHHQFISRQHVVFAGDMTAEPQQWTEDFAKQLKRKRYRVWQDGTALLAEKNRFSRWGPYINHIGLIVFLLAVLARGIPGWHMDQYVWLYEGETKPIPHSNYYIKSNKFVVDYYKDEELGPAMKGKKVVKLYETKAELYECTEGCGDATQTPVLKKVHEHDIRVNSPLSYKGLSLYQNNYSENVRLLSVKPLLTDSKTGESFGPFELPTSNPPSTYEAGPYKLKLNGYYPDFKLDEQGRPMTNSRDPNNPAFIFAITGPGLPELGETYIYFPMPAANDKALQDQINQSFAKQGLNSGRFGFKVGKMENVSLSQYSTFLNIRVDRAMPYVWTGAGISMIGLIMGFYWQHRRIWLRIDDGRLTLGAHTNKNTYGLRSDIAQALGKTGIEVSAKQLDNRRNTR